MCIYIHHVHPIFNSCVRHCNVHMKFELSAEQSEIPYMMCFLSMLMFPLDCILIY